MFRGKPNMFGEEEENVDFLDILKEEEKVEEMLVSCPTLKCGASPIPSAFTADDFIRELRAGSRQPHPIGLVIRWAKLIAEFKSRL